jgi:hypothetical protein
MIKPEKEYQFTLNNLLNNRSYAPMFFNTLLNLNKFLANETRDPFAKTELDRNPEYTDWDKFAFYEYQKLTAEDSDENQEPDDVKILKIYLIPFSLVYSILMKIGKELKPMIL